MKRDLGVKKRKMWRRSSKRSRTERMIQGGCGEESGKEKRRNEKGKKT